MAVAARRARLADMMATTSVAKVQAAGVPMGNSSHLEAMTVMTASLGPDVGRVGRSTKAEAEGASSIDARGGESGSLNALNRFAPWFDVGQRAGLTEFVYGQLTRWYEALLEGKGANKGVAPPKPEPPRKYCTHCKRDGHDVSECRKRAAAERDNRGGNWCGGYSEATGKKTGKGDVQVQCYKCKQFGHVAKQCPNK